MGEWAQREMAVIRRFHGSDGGGSCAGCGVVWPCDAEVLLQEVARLSHVEALAARLALAVASAEDRAKEGGKAAEAVRAAIGSARLRELLGAEE